MIQNDPLKQSSQPELEVLGSVGAPYQAGLRDPVRLQDVRQSLFMRDLSKTMDEIRVQVEEKRNLLSSLKIDPSPIFDRMSLHLKSGSNDEKKLARELQISINALQEIERSLKRGDKELDVLNSNFSKSGDELQRKIDQDRLALNALITRQNEIEERAALATEREKKEGWLVSKIFGLFREAAPNQEMLLQGRRSIAQARLRLVEDERQLGITSKEVCSLYERRDSLYHLSSTVEKIRRLIEWRLDGVELKNRPPKKDLAASSTTMKGFRFGITIPVRFFHEMEQILPRLILSQEQSRQVQQRLAASKKKNDTGFSSNDEAVTELHVLLGDLRGLLGPDNDLVRFVLHAFAEMMEDVV